MIQTGGSISQRQAEATLKILQEAIDKILIMSGDPCVI